MAYRKHCKICGTLMDLRKRYSYVQTYGCERTFGGEQGNLACTSCSKSKYAELLASHWDSLEIAEDELSERFEKAAGHMIEEWKKECLPKKPV